MLFNNYDFDTYMAVVREEGREEGIEIGAVKERKDFVNILKSGKSLDEIIKMYDPPPTN